MQDLGGEAFFFAQQAQQQMLGTDVLVVQALRFFGAIGEHALALMAERQVHGGGHFLSDRGVRFNLFADGLDGRVGAQEAVRQRLILPQQAQQQVLSFNIGASELAGLVSCKKNYSARLFGITFKHSYRRPSTLSDVPIPADRADTVSADQWVKSPFSSCRTRSHRVANERLCVT